MTILVLFFVSSSDFEIELSSLKIVIRNDVNQLVTADLHNHERLVNRYGFACMEKFQLIVDRRYRLLIHIFHFGASSIFRFGDQISSLWYISFWRKNQPLGVTNECNRMHRNGAASRQHLKFVDTFVASLGSRPPAPVFFLECFSVQKLRWTGSLCGTPATNYFSLYII